VKTIKKEEEGVSWEGKMHFFPLFEKIAKYFRVVFSGRYPQERTGSASGSCFPANTELARARDMNTSGHTTSLKNPLIQSAPMVPPAMAAI
jgi:hypothetical protein